MYAEDDVWKAGVLCTAHNCVWWAQHRCSSMQMSRRHWGRWLQTMDFKPLTTPIYLARQAQRRPDRYLEKRYARERHARPRCSLQVGSSTTLFDALFFTRDYALVALNKLDSGISADLSFFIAPSVDSEESRRGALRMSEMNLIFMNSISIVIVEGGRQMASIESHASQVQKPGPHNT
jgi:hypothetical protein